MAGRKGGESCLGLAERGGSLVWGWQKGGGVLSGAGRRVMVLTVAGRKEASVAGRGKRKGRQLAEETDYIDIPCFDGIYRTRSTNYVFDPTPWHRDH